MTERPFDPVAIQRALDNFTANIAKFAESVGAAVSKILDGLDPTRRVDETVRLAQARSAHGGNGALVGDQWVCASCMGWLHDGCPGLGCDCRARAHR